MKERTLNDLFEFAGMILTILSVTYWINSILQKGFGQEPVSYFVGMMFIALLLFFRNFFTVKNVNEFSFKVIQNKNPDITDYISYIFYILLIDLFFLLLNII